MFHPCRDRSVASMPPDLRPGPDSPPTDELASAEATLGVLQQVLHTIASDDMSRQTPCTEFDVARADRASAELDPRPSAGMADAEFPIRDRTSRSRWNGRSSARPGRPWTPGTAAVWTAACRSGPSEMPATVAAGVLSIEFLVHAWDYAAPWGTTSNAPDALAEYVWSLARRRSSGRRNERGRVRRPVEVPADAGALDQLIAFTGRNPVDVDASCTLVDESECQLHARAPTATSVSDNPFQIDLEARFR